jgi:hypothetical protein
MHEHKRGNDGQVNWNDVVNNIKATRHFLLTTFNIINFKEDTKEALIVTARDMDSKERKSYGKK